MKRLIYAVYLLCFLTTLSGEANAQSNWATVAVPVYSPAHLMMGLHGGWTVPQADKFATEAAALTAVVSGLCAPSSGEMARGLNNARQQWRKTTTQWEMLSAVAVGPLLERRSARQIDFSPTRPTLIERAIEAAPAGAGAMEQIGSPAKGLPALEWLLWTRPAQPGQRACAYAVEVARNIEREAVALQTAFQLLADRAPAAWDEEAAVLGMNEFINQWVGAIERLRWAQMEKPLRSGRKQELPRAASATPQASWLAHWTAIRALGQLAGQIAPVPGQGPVPIETYLRGLGLNALAGQFVSALGSADRKLQLARPEIPATVGAAGKELSSLKRLTEAEVAPALNVRIGFSDADGD